MLDLVISNGIVIDTKNTEQHPLNIGIKDNKIVVATNDVLEGIESIDATGLYVCPGFIDPHGHIDGHPYSGELSACQGITTTIGGNCGLSPLSTGHFLREQEEKGFIINQAELIGHSFTLRKQAGISDVYRKATNKEIDRMCGLASEALEEGACGISFGLDYSPGASYEEILQLAKVCAKYDKVMPVHTRLFTLYDNHSLYEMLSIARATCVKLLISHFVYQYGEGLMEDALEIIEKARQSGLNIMLDSGMYTNWATLVDTATFDERTLRDNDVMLSKLIVATGKYYGRHLTPSLYKELRKYHKDDSIICITNCKDEMYMALNRSYCMPSTDIGPYQKGEGHPQIAGTYPKYIKEMVRERGDLSIEMAVKKASYLPAKLFGFCNKGQIDVGYDADITILNLQEIEDLARFPHEGYPDTKPKGIYYVIINGKIVVDQGMTRNERAGRVIDGRNG
ncbi:amidohydrolase family protein [Anaeromicropila herbilytica]|uniref:D-aminoacylase n=1 Tax=Anaeromicropila herbilytica TaxID=2785025 RepID=A0A7R7ICZ6_9FIRM|nr:amidohydrolase family protein [Anaeromicropila herbilytica]BCN31263.1 D-aminoacylase [Anaeromicropila herbilytica]